MKKLVIRAAVLVGLSVAIYFMRGELMGAAATVTRAVGLSGTSFDWPPQLGEEYPDVQLVDQDGKLTRLSDFRGKPILIEPIGMNCPGCQAFCGAGAAGGFGGVKPQAGLDSIDKLSRRYGGFNLEEVIHVHLLLYNMEMEAPSPKEAAAWAKHFGMDRSKNQIVLAADASMLGDESYNMIPGFQFIDREFVLQSDSTGHKPQHDLYRELLPKVGSAVGNGGSRPPRKLIIREL